MHVRRRIQLGIPEFVHIAAVIERVQYTTTGPLRSSKLLFLVLARSHI